MEPLVHRLGYVALNVPDLDAAITDSCQIAGAALVDRTPERALLTSNARHAELILHASDHASLRAVGLETLDAANVDEVARRARAAGLQIISETPSLPVIERAVTIAFPEGHVIEVHTPMPRDRSARYPGPGIHPRCIDHVNLSATDPATSVDLMVKVLGLKLTERTEGWELVWMRAGDGRHHTLAFLKSPEGGGMHHYSWEFADFADFKRLGDLLDTQDRTLAWGPGRHGAGDNIFAYYVDAAGFMVETTAEMEIIADPNFQPRIVDPGENLSNYKVVNRWGQLPSEPWMTHFNICAVIK